MGNEAQTSCSKTLFPIIGYDNIFLCSLGATEITSVINFVEVVAKPQRVRCDIMCERVGSVSYWSGFRGSALLVRLEECILGTDSSPAASGGATAAFPDMKVWFLALRTAAALAEDTAVASTPCLCLPPPSPCSPDFPYTFHSQWVPQPTEPRGVPWAAVSPPLVLCQVFVTSFLFDSLSGSCPREHFKQAAYSRVNRECLQALNILWARVCLQTHEQGDEVLACFQPPPV